MNSDRNPYAPPQSRTAVFHKAPRIKPRRVKWAVTALWVAYGLGIVHAAIVIGDRLALWPPEYVVLTQLGSELFYALLIYFVSGGRYSARLIYAVLLGVRTINVFRGISDAWQSSHALVLVTVISFSCQYTAMYWLFTESGRRWFVGSRVD